jgi:uncharacterized phiE125 gp8 family phage protein
MMFLRPAVIVPPATLPVTLAEAKFHLRVDHAFDDALITGYIARATGYFDSVDGVLGRCLEPQTLEMALDAFPAAEIQLPLGPAASVVEIPYIDTDGVERVVNSTDYVLDDFPVEGWIVPLADVPWPATMNTVNAVRVRWVAGTGCPEPVKQEILLMVGDLYNKREAAGGGPADITLALPFRRMHV